MIVYSEEVKELVEYLVAKEFAVIINNKPILTKKFKDVFTEPEILFVEEVIEEPIKKVVDKRAVWNKFIADCAIPHRVNTLTGAYTVRQWNQPANNKLVQILNVKGLDYDTLVASTKNYYTTVTYKILLSKYLLNDVWRDEYEEWIKNKGSIATNDGSSKWED